MDIKVITRHAPSNYGSLLQSIATIKIIERLGHKCEIIDYIRHDEHGLKGCLTALEKKKKWGANVLTKIIYISLRYPEEVLAEHKFLLLRKKFLKLTKRYSTKENLEKLTADVFITGSDQVWGPTINGKYDSAYFLSFVKSSKRIAFAASFGKTKFNNDIANEYKKLLSNYDYITVREDSAVDLLNNWKINCIGQVLDPTLILTENEWNKYIKKEQPKQQYILIYQIHNDKSLGDYAHKFAKHTGLPLIRISAYLHQKQKNEKLIYLPDISTFLFYFKYATYIITDSFHGTAFAINFKKQFIEILPNTNTDSRNRSILHLTHLENRILNDFNDFSLKNQIINYSDVNNILSIEREHSLSLLNKMLNNK